MTTSATFVGVTPGMDFGHGLRSDGAGGMTVPTGVAGGTSNVGAAVMTAIRAGGIPLPPQTAGYTTARAAVRLQPSRARRRKRRFKQWKRPSSPRSQR
jgi:hypothetical protein